MYCRKCFQRRPTTERKLFWTCRRIPEVLASIGHGVRMSGGAGGVGLRFNLMPVGANINTDDVAVRCIYLGWSLLPLSAEHFGRLADIRLPYSPVS